MVRFCFCVQYWMQSLYCYVTVLCAKLSCSCRDWTVVESCSNFVTESMAGLTNIWGCFKFAYTVAVTGPGQVDRLGTCDLLRKEVMCCPGPPGPGWAGPGSGLNIYSASATVPMLGVATLYCADSWYLVGGWLQAAANGDFASWYLSVAAAGSAAAGEPEPLGLGRSHSSSHVDSLSGRLWRAGGPQPGAGVASCTRRVIRVKSSDRDSEARFICNSTIYNIFKYCMILLYIVWCCIRWILYTIFYTDHVLPVLK